MSHLTSQQYATLKAHILADPVLAGQPLTSGGALVIAEALNLPASPAFTVWKTSVSRDDVTVDGFDWTQVDNLTTGQARIWDLLFDNASRAINFGELGKRSAISECWKGTAGKVAVATFIFSKAKRSATRLEKLFATGTGSDASPGVLVLEGLIDSGEVQQARES